MSLTLNKVHLIGFLTGNPEEKVTESGKLIVSFPIETYQDYLSYEGEQRRRVDNHLIVIFGNFGKSCLEKLKIGDKVYIEGSIQSNVWEGETGEPKAQIEVVSKYIIFLDKTKQPE